MTNSIFQIKQEMEMFKTEENKLQAYKYWCQKETVKLITKVIGIVSGSLGALISILELFVS